MASILNATTSSGLVTSADNSGSLQLATNNGTTAVTIDTSQNVGIGTASPATRLDVRCPSDVTQDIAYFSRPDALVRAKIALDGSGIINFGTSTNHPLAFLTNNTERMRITSAGDLCVNRTSTLGSVKFVVESDTTTYNPMTVSNTRSTASTDYSILFYRNGSIVGSVQTSLSATSYVTSSDYRLKENIAPMTGALAKVVQLKPVTYTWKATGETSQGFIAHELQAIVPECVTGEKDGEQMQGVDTSFLVATLTAAIQELKAELDATKAEVQALKGTL